MKRNSEFDPEHKKEPQVNPERSAPNLDVSAYEGWNNLCAAIADDALLDETPPGTPDDVVRIRERIAEICTKQAAYNKALEELEWHRRWGEGSPQKDQPERNPDEHPSLRKM